MATGTRGPSTMKKALLIGCGNERGENIIKGCHAAGFKVTNIGSSVSKLTHVHSIKRDWAKLDITEVHKILQKLVKQRKDSASIFSEQNREDLAIPELEQAEIISRFLPKQMSENEVEIVVVEIISKTGANSMKDMGKVMGLTNSQLAGKADGKTISGIVKKLLSN